MRLRAQAKAPVYCEVSSGSEEEDDAIEEYSPVQDRRKAEAARKKPTPCGRRAAAQAPKCPELLPLVLNTCNVRPLFNTASLRALRATSKTLQEAVDRLFPLTDGKCKKKGPCRCVKLLKFSRKNAIAGCNW